MTFFRWLLCIAACLALGRAVGGENEAGGVTTEQVDAALKRGAQAGLRNLDRFRRAGNMGYSIVSVMALLNAGVSRDDRDVNAAITYIVREADHSLHQYEGAYEAGLTCMLLHMLKDPAHRRLAERMAHFLQNRQSPDGSWGDNSRTQFALLGLKAAQDLGVKVPPEVFKRARRYIESGQVKADGSWGYQPGSATGYGSMTAAGITSLFIINEQLNKESTFCGAAPGDNRIQKALGWLGDHFTVETNPTHGYYHYYYLYALERIGVLTGQKFIGGHDWYREGAAYLVRHQLDDGNWQDGTSLATEFALLFLGKGREPVVLQKLAFGGEWNPDPYDAKYLVEQASRDLGMPMTYQAVEAGASANALAAAPVLYIQGHSATGFRRGTREAIRTFLEQGGFVFASACCGSTDFDKSFRTEMALMFPDATFDRLPPNHEIFAGPHKIADPDACVIEGLNVGCRTAVFYAPNDICCGWGGCKGCTSKTPLAGQEALDLGVNMIAYALGFKQMTNKLENPTIAIGKAHAQASRNIVAIGQLCHNGDWNPDPASIPNLGKTLREQTGNTAEFVKRAVVLGADDLGDYPLLYLTGHKTFQFQPVQVDILRAYLDRGGFLLADPCCGKAEFDAAFRQLCAQLYPGRPLAPLTPSHPVMKEPNGLDKVEYKPAVKKLFPNIGDAPQVEGISAPDGRLQVLYSRFNFGCELQGHVCLNCLGLAKQDAYRLAVNAVLYALSH